MRPRYGRLWTVIAVLASAAPIHAQNAARKSAIHIVVLEGNGAINNIDVQRAHAPVVKVVDGDGAPVPNANVTFTLPSSGPGGEFVGGQQMLTVHTEQDGTATARGLKPNHTAGQFEIRVAASAGGETARATVTQTNVLPTVEKSKSKLYIIVGVVAAAAAGGLIAATRGSNGSSTPSGAPTPAGSVSAGAPTFGPPR